MLSDTDITEYVSDVDTISRTTSYPHALETSPDTCSIVLDDEEGEFSPDNISNFFVSKMFPQNGKQTPVNIQYNSKVLFNGQIDEVTSNPEAGRITIACIDKTYPIQKDVITDFGIEKSWRPVADQEQTNPLEGVYPVTCGVSPLSKGSVSGKNNAGSDLNVVDEIKSAGILDPLNISVNGEIQSEGGEIPVTDKSSYPQVSGKAPYRYKQIKTLVDRILTHYGIPEDKRQIEIPDINIGSHFSVYGRVGYESSVGNIGATNPLRFGVITDFVVDGDIIYFVFSISRGGPGSSQIIKYDRTTDKEESILTLPTGRECWGLAKIGNNLIMMLTQSEDISDFNDTPALGSYDSRTNTRVTLSYFDVTSNNVAVTGLVPTSDARPPQLAHFYQLGERINVSAPSFLRSFLPDTRRRIVVSGSNIYYGFAKDNRAGIARVQIGTGGGTTEVMSFNTDSKNHAGFIFKEFGNDLILGTTFFTAERSIIKLVRG